MNLSSSFINGFIKTAGIASGVKSLRPLSSAGRMVGNKPSSMVTTTSAYKPTPIPTIKPSSATNNLSTNLQNSVKVDTKIKTKSTKSAPGGMHI